MENFVLMKQSKEREELSKKLGFTRILFLERDFVLIKEKSKSGLVKKIKEAKKRKLLVGFRPAGEELLRFALERTKVDFILGAELINPKDSVHFVRGGWDQITCKIAARNKKIIAFSFSDVLNIKDKGKLLARMKLNVKLAKKYRVKMLLSNFSLSEGEIRSAKDLGAFFRVLNN